MPLDDFEDWRSEQRDSTSLSSELGEEDLLRMGELDPDFVR